MGQKVVKAPEQKTGILNIRIRPSVKAAASARAEADGRSLANYIEWVISQDIEARPEPDKRKPRR